VSRFLILHGLDGSGPGHWQPWLALRLRDAGEDFSFPDLPNPSDPDPDAWERAAEVELVRDPGPVVICHSLACLLWLRLAARSEPPRAERVLLVAPPCPDDIPAVTRFLDHGATAADVERAADATLLVCSDNDPYCPPGAVATFAKPLGIVSRLLRGAGHINTDAGYGPWPDVETWVLTGSWP
jgi:predicted alpha/beta hydrolase family esterase